MDAQRWLAKTVRRCRRRFYDAVLWSRSFSRRLARPREARGYRPKHIGPHGPGRRPDAGHADAWGGWRRPGDGIIAGLSFSGSPESRFGAIHRARAIRRAAVYYAFLGFLVAILVAYRINPALPNLAQASFSAWFRELAAFGAEFSMPKVQTDTDGPRDTDPLALAFGRESLEARGLLSRSIPQMSARLGVSAEPSSPAEQVAGALETAISAVTGMRFSRPETLLVAEVGRWPRWSRAVRSQTPETSPLQLDTSAHPAARTPQLPPSSSPPPQNPSPARSTSLSSAEKLAAVTRKRESGGGEPSHGAGLPPSAAGVADLGRLLATQLRAVDFGTKPLIFIYHTHSSEAYHGRMAAHDKSLDYSERDQVGVLTIGDTLAWVLQDRYHIPVLHSRRFHDLEDLRGAYGRSKVTLLETLKTYPSIIITVDVHRDGIPTKQNPPESLLVEKINGVDVARVQILVGKGDPVRRYNQNWRQNLNLAQLLHGKLESMYPGLSRGVVVRDDWPYNMDLFRGALLVEIGDHYNTVDEARRAAVLLADAMAATVADIAKRQTPPMLRQRP